MVDIVGVLMLVVCVDVNLCLMNVLGLIVDDLCNVVCVVNVILFIGFFSDGNIIIVIIVNDLVVCVVDFVDLVVKI